MKSKLHDKIMNVLVLSGVCIFIAGFTYPFIMFVYLLYLIGRLFIVKYIEKDSFSLSVIIGILLIGPISGIIEYLDYWHQKKCSQKSE